MPQTSKQTLALGLALVASFLLIFTGFGFFWVGLPGACLLLAGAYAVVAFAAARVSTMMAALVATGLGLLPLAGIIVRFRDSSGSHLLPLAILSVWCGAALWGAWLGAERAVAVRRIAFAVAAATILHAMAAAAALLLSIGDALARFDSGAAAQWPSLGGLAGVLMEPMVSALSTGNVRVSRAAQWLFFAVNSANWGVALALAIQTITHLRRPAMPITRAQTSRP
ncbi:MAG: hypothetical protein JNJ55_08435 [Betaproteobacteria bacterium]|nr:hypothetical protein [Betaproteobacteria bacterium]